MPRMLRRGFSSGRQVLKASWMMERQSGLLQSSSHGPFQPQKFDYFLIIDFEATCLHKQPIKPQEIIEFPCLKVNARNFDVVAEFHRYVKPVHHPTLSVFCSELTGILQETVQNESTFPEVFQAFQDWIREEALLESRFCFVSCGDWDLRTMLPAQCELCQLQVPDYLHRWINIKKSFHKSHRSFPRHLTAMLTEFGLEFEGRPHMENTSNSDMDSQDSFGNDEANANDAVPVVEDEELVREGVFNQIRNSLNQNGIKLWVEPYCKEGIPQGDKLLELACSLSPVLGIDDMTLMEGIKYLQSNALEKLAARDTLNKSGQIQLRLKIPRNLVKESVSNLVEVNREARGCDLAESVATIVKCSPDALKLVANGKVINNDLGVLEQGLKPGMVLMIVSLNKNDKSLQVLDEQRKILNETIQDAKLLGCDDGSGPGLSIANQTGESLNLPDIERKALIIAMSLHEKGRFALKQKNYDLALILLLEARSEYSQCRSDILHRVDNYALLNLDIAWCYLKLGNVSQLPNAEDRLSECENLLRKSYGQDMERVVQVKGQADTEKAIYVRMHLLQGIAAFHQGHKSRAGALLALAKSELAELDVSEDALSEVVALGYSEKEARLALRATKGNLAEAVTLAQNQREERRRVKEEEVERKRKRQKFGKTQDGRFVNIGFVQTMVNMGIGEDFAVEALRQTNNSIEEAIAAVQDNPDMIEAALLTSLEDQRNQAGSSDSKTKAEFKKDVKKAKSEAVKRMKSETGGLGKDDDHLDLDLKEETDLVQKYLGFLTA
eukprot:TCALIF_06526-PA protein Name:"Similar to NUB1 NEDD8 ultimate buster 1 (Homo sapiens)" AED:0.17 eAED:0.17 QI:0/0.66/0.57/0.85/0.83/0.71/7/149/781